MKETTVRFFYSANHPNKQKIAIISTSDHQLAIVVMCSTNLAIAAKVARPIQEDIGLGSDDGSRRFPLSTRWFFPSFLYR